MIHGRVLARPQTHITYNNTTGEIELYAEVIEILDASIPYQEVLAQIQKATAVHGSSVTLGNVNDFTYRSHNCGELRETDIGKVVTLCGWLEFSRMKRFFTLRDAYGQIQVLIPDDVSCSFFYVKQNKCSKPNNIFIISFHLRSHMCYS